MLHKDDVPYNPVQWKRFKIEPFFDIQFNSKHFIRPQGEIQKV